MKSAFLFLIIAFFGLLFDRLNVFKYCILSAILHEAGHIRAYIIAEHKFPKIKISVFGFRMENNVSHNKNYIFILLAGPFVNLIIALTALLRLRTHFSLNCYVMMAVNAVLFIINMLPVYYLDGGQVLYSISSVYQRKYRQISAVFILVFSVMVFYFTDNLLTLFALFLYFIINIANDI